MSDLISRSALLERLAFKRDNNRLYQKSTYAGLESAISQVKKAPDVDAVPVVRCKDCKYHEDEEIGIVYCPNAFGGWVGENWFCADGERKEVLTDGC